MNLQRAQRKRAKIKMGLQGPSGSGKTYSALLVGYGLCNSNWNNLAVIDSENHSAELYSHLGEFNVLNLTDPFTPEKYIQAIEICEKAGMEVLIIDSLTHEWLYLLDYHSSLQGNSFTSWSKVSPRHDKLIQKILQSPCHIIVTMRTKQDYVLVEKNNKMVPEKVGLKSIQRDGLEFELSLVFDLDMKNHATVSKDRTGLFTNCPEEKLKIQTGKDILDWCNSGADVKPTDVSARIGDCKTIKELLDLYQEYPQFKEVLKPEFEQQKRSILINKEATAQLANQKIIQNGTI